jgi:hypothetical protein
MQRGSCRAETAQFGERDEGFEEARIHEPEAVESERDTPNNRYKKLNVIGENPRTR